MKNKREPRDFGWIITLAFVSLLFAGCSTAIDDQNHALAKRLAKTFEARLFIGQKGVTLRYRFLPPPDYDPSQKYPLVVSLHHAGVHGVDNTIQLSSQPVPMLAIEGNRRKYPAFLFVPQCPEGAFFGRAPFHVSVDSLVFEAMEAFEEEFSIDAQRRYVTGISGGALGTWNLISQRPEVFAAAVPISGGGDSRNGEKLTDIAIWAFHGEKDNLAPVVMSRNVIKAIQEAGGNPRYTEFPGKGHDIWPEVAATPGLLEWLFSQEKQ